MQVKEKEFKLGITSIKIAFFLVIPFSGLPQKNNQKVENTDSLIIYHYNRLASVVKSMPKDTIYYCCSGSIMYIEEKSNIFSKSDFTFAGKLYFTKSDFIKWQKWFLDRLRPPTLPKSNL